MGSLFQNRIGGVQAFTNPNKAERDLDALKRSIANLHASYCLGDIAEIDDAWRSMLRIADVGPDSRPVKQTRRRTQLDRVAGETRFSFRANPRGGYLIRRKVDGLEGSLNWRYFSGSFGGWVIDFPGFEAGNQHLAFGTMHANVFFFRTLERAKVALKQANIPLSAAAN
jgi:hypothetical protein